MTRPQHRLRRGAWIALLATAPITTWSCGGSEEPAPGTSDSSPGTTTPATAPATAPSTARPDRSTSGAAAPAPTGRPQDAPTLPIRPQPPRIGPEHGAVAATVDPANPADPWPTERLALATEDALESFVRRVLASDDAAARGLLTRAAKVTVTDEDGSSSPAPEALPGALRDRLGVTAPDPVIAVDVVAVEAPSLGADEAAAPRGSSTAVVRVGTAPARGAGSSNVEARFRVDVVWRLGKRSRIASFDARDFVRHEAAPAFRDVTSSVLDLGARRGDVIGTGALEAVGRTDRLSPRSDVYLGMHGMAVGDVTGDGQEDLFVGRAAGQPNLLFVNRDGRLVEEAAARGLDHLDDTGGALIVDLDGDGARDVVFGRLGDVVVAWNGGDGTFDSVAALPASRPDRVYSLAAADVDGDGDLDLYDTRYFAAGGYGAQAPLPYHDAMNGAPNVFWRNLAADGEPRGFRDDTEAVGLDAENDRFSLSATFDDFDGDGDLDLYVTNDFGRNSLYVWADGKFEARPDAMGLVDKAAGMGVSVADVDLDGLDDVVVSNMHSTAGMRVTREAGFGRSLNDEVRAEFMRHARGNSLFKGVAPGEFEDVTGAAGTGPGGWAWGARFVDWDRDGLPDIVVPNGFLSGRRGPDLQSFFWRRVVGTTPLRPGGAQADVDRYLLGWAVIGHLSQFEELHWNGEERTYSYANRGGFRFDDVSLVTGLGFADDGRALCEMDYDRDGRVDLVFRNRTSPILRVMQGAAPHRSWVAFDLEQPGLNRDAIGARVTIVAAGVERSERVVAGDGFLGGSSTTVRFGLGDAKELEALRVIWPDGVTEDFDLRASGGSVVSGAWLLRRGESTPVLRHRGHDGSPTAATRVAAPLADAAPGPRRSRIDLFDPIPLGAWRIPQPDGPARRVDELMGPQGLALVMWSSGARSADEALAPWARARGALSAAGVELWLASLDGVRAGEAMKAALASVGLADAGSRLDRSGRMVLEMALARTLAPFAGLPEPVVLQFDGAGDLVAIWMGLGDPERVAANATPESRARGTWVDGEAPRRTLDDVPAKLEQLSLNELADHMRDRLSRDR